MKEIDEYLTVQRWFNLGSYTQRTRRVYTKYMKTFCRISKKTPDELIHDVETSRVPITTIEDLHRKLAEYMINEKGMLVRSVDQRLNALHSFYEANGIELTVENKRQLRHVTWDVYSRETTKKNRQDKIRRSSCG